jgi:hypothetical protein
MIYLKCVLKKAVYFYFLDERMTEKKQKKEKDDRYSCINIFNSSVFVFDLIKKT